MRCFERASKVAAVEGSELLRRETMGERFGLLNSPLCKFAVQMALVAAFRVPDRFAMADDDEVRGRFQTLASYCTRMR